MSSTGETTNVIEEAVKVIDNFSDLPWVEANEKWGREGIARADVRLLGDEDGFKNWKWDIGCAFSEIARAFKLRKATSLEDVMGDSFRDHMRMAWFYLFKSNELNRPDGKVSGTTLYGIWVEEAWHAAIWSPVVALAVKELLMTHPESPEAVKVAELLIQQRKRLSDNE